MDKNCDHGGDNMSLPQKNVEKDFADFVSKNRDLINRIAKSNTIKNNDGLTVIGKNDPSRDEHEWNDLYKELHEKK